MRRYFHGEGFSPGPFGKLLPSDRRSNLSNAATSLIPRDFNEVMRQYGACNEFGLRPNCVIIDTSDPEHDLEQRVALVRARARAGGWLETDNSVSEGATRVYFDREGYTAAVSVRRNFGDGVCSNESPTACFDHFSIEIR